jgi:hypothetical protein
VCQSLMIIFICKVDSVPEYNDATWFTMLFSCGVSTLYTVNLPTVPDCDEVGIVPEFNDLLYL